MRAASPETAGRTGLERLELADWRRRVAELYAEVRLLASADPAAAHARWRGVREMLYRSHPASPVASDCRSGFRALHFPYDPKLRFELPLVPDEQHVAKAEHAAEGLILPISTGRPLGFDRIGWLEVPFDDGPRRLALFWLPEYSGSLFLPFRDVTNGHETYGGGRYLLDTAKGADLGGHADGGTVTIDFNFAYQPSCAFDPRWSCPLSPPENLLNLEVRAGERVA